MPTHEEILKEEVPIEGAEEAPIGSLTLNSLQLPEVVDWEDEKEYRLEIRTKQTNKREENELTAADFQILDVKSIKEPEPEEEEEVIE